MIDYIPKAYKYLGDDNENDSNSGLVITYCCLKFECQKWINGKLFAPKLNSDRFRSCPVCHACYGEN